MRITFSVRLLCMVSLWLLGAAHGGFAEDRIGAGQTPSHRAPGDRCGTMEVLDRQLLEDPTLAERMWAIEDLITRVNSMRAASRISGTIEIPVHVIVVYANAQENISDLQIESQIAVLNEDFQKLNNDWQLTPTEFIGSVGNVEVLFTLQGIERYADPTPSWGLDDSVKYAYPPYSPDTHLNFWVADIGDSILGYAQFPGGNPATDGVVISPPYFGSSDYDDGSFFLGPPYDKGRTATHEVGHWLNLYHIWGDGGCSVDDLVSDTPIAADANFSCPVYPSKSCVANGGWDSDMFMNYMDYVDDTCMVMFSNGQVDRMRAVFEPGGPRETFLLAAGATPSCSAVACDGNIDLSLILDNFPGETSWVLEDEVASSVVDEGHGYSVPNASVAKSWVLNPGAYTFSVFDSYGDGICCAEGNGSYSLNDGCANTLVSGGAFGSRESTTFCVLDSDTCGTGDSDIVGPVTYTGFKRHRSTGSLTTLGSVVVDVDAALFFESNDGIQLSPGFQVKLNSSFSASVGNVSCF